MRPDTGGTLESDIRFFHQLIIYAAHRLFAKSSADESPQARIFPLGFLADVVAYFAADSILSFQQRSGYPATDERFIVVAIVCIRCWVLYHNIPCDQEA